MEWNDLRIFLAIARAGTLAGAAKRIGQTQPTMGRRLRTLEAAVGDALFQRTSEGFVLTAEGTVMLAHAERVEEEVLGLERKLSGRDAGLEGLIRISSSDWFGVHMLTPVFANFSKKHPGVTIELITDARLFSLSRREADMVFRIRPFDEAYIVQRKLMHMPYGLYAARGTRVARNSQGQGLALVTMDTAFGGLPDVTWLQRVLPHAPRYSAATTARLRRGCAPPASVWPCFPALWATRPPASSCWTWAKRHPAAMCGWGITATCVDWRD